MYNQQGTAYQENLLCDTIDRMRRNPEGRKIVHIHLSRLLPANRTPLKTRIVSRMFKNLESGMMVQIFPMTNLDLVLTVNGGAQRDVNSVTNRIRALFETDPATFAEDEQGNDRFVTWYVLEVDSAMALHLAQSLRDEALQTSMQPPAAAAQPSLGPKELDWVAKQIAAANIIPYIRDQVAMRVDPTNAEASIEFYEFFLSVGDLQRAAAPGYNLFGDRWLFQDLSRTMDLRMLETVIRAPHARGAPAISLNLNLETCTTAAFKTFVSKMEEGQKLIVEVQVIDLLSNLDLYYDVQGALSNLGHALLIDGLNPTIMQMLDVGRLQPDYVKMMWVPELLDTMDPAGIRSAWQLIQDIGAHKVILSRCDSQPALGWGLKSGITVFQGHFLDSFGKPNRRRGRR